MSMKLTPATWTATSTWPGPATGSGRSWHSITSGPPGRIATIVFIAVCPFWNECSITDKKKRLRSLQGPQRQPRHGSDLGRTGAAARGKADAGNVGQQETGSMARIEFGRQLALGHRLPD